MTRNIISHDSRRRGNTKYYPAKAPAGRLSTTPVASLLRLYFALGSSPQDMRRSRNAMINWLSRVMTWPQKACARSRPRERLTSSRSRRSFRGNDRTILTSAHRETVRHFLHLSFARGVIYRSYFPSRASAKGIRRYPPVSFCDRFSARLYPLASYLYSLLRFCRN